MPVQADDATVAELCAAYWRHVKAYYRKPDGSATTEQGNTRTMIRSVKELYATTPAKDFTPQCLRAVRQHMVDDRDLSRGVANQQTSLVKRMFKWGVAEGIVAVTVYQALLTLDGLKRGRCDARETEPVRPVAMHLVDGVKDHVSRQVRALIELQLFTAARAGELVTMRRCDIDTSGRVWLYKPDDHKTAHHGHGRTVYIGPKAQQAIAPFMLNRAPDAYLFSPAEAEAERLADLHAKRTTPMSCGNKPGDNNRGTRARTVGDTYTVDSYRRAIKRACDLAFPPTGELARIKIKGKRGKRWETMAEWRERVGRDGWAEVKAWRKEHRWHPHQLRHNAATNLRKEFGIEVARIALGHRSAAITQIYAELDTRQAEAAMLRVG